MSNPAKSLNAFVDWQSLPPDVLDTLHLAPALPAEALCPLCDEGLVRIYQDHQVGGQRFHCPDCNVHGDLIQLTSRVWKLGIEDTIAGLRNHGIDISADEAAVAKYQAQYLDYQQRLAGLWDEARQMLKRPDGELNRLLSRYNLHQRIPQLRWLQTAGQILGGLETVKIERAFAPGVMRHADKKHQRSSPSEHAIFQGPDWNDALVVPYYDLPGRITAFFFVGREHREDSSFVFRRANLGFRGNGHSRQPAEAGLAFHPGVLTMSHGWDGNVFAMSDVIDAVRLQMRHFVGSTLPLPIVTWFDSQQLKVENRPAQRVKTQHAWEMFGNRKIIFWMPNFSRTTLQQAIAANGLISTVGPRVNTTGAMGDFTSKYAPAALLHHIQQSARPWPEALKLSLDEMSDAEAEKVFHWLRLEGEDVEGILRRCVNRVHSRITQILSVSGKRTAKFNGWNIIERENGWYVVGGRFRQEEQICNAIVRFDKVVQMAATKETYLQGEVTFRGESIEFCERQERVEKEGFEWLQDLLTEHGGLMPVFNPTFSKYLMDIAKLFHLPQLAQGVDCVGWDDDQMAFILPHATIGFWASTEGVEHAVLPEDTPAQDLLLPGQLWRDDFDVVQDNDYTSRLFWATFSSILANIMAHTSHQQLRGVGLAGEGAQAMGEALANAMGCQSHLLHSIRDVHSLLAQEHRHKWPVFASEDGRLHLTARRLLLEGKPDSRDLRNLITPVSFDEVSDLLQLDEWNIITGEQPVNVSEKHGELASKLLPAYLEDVCQRRLRLVEWEGVLPSYVELIVRDLAQFVDQREGNSAVVLGALEVVEVGIVVATASPVMAQ